MKKIITITLFLNIFSSVSSQTLLVTKYNELITTANTLFENKKYEESGKMFLKAFESNFDMGYVKDRYKAACAWALAKNKENAFFQIERIVKYGNYTDLSEITNDKDLISLHSEKQWIIILDLIKKNIKKE
jgi:hypothetical protein